MIQLDKNTPAVKNEAVSEPFTHRLEFVVLMTDLTTRNIQISFNGWDEWHELGGNPSETALGLHACMAKGLVMDRLVLGWKATRIDLQNGSKRVEFDHVIKPAIQ